MLETGQGVASEQPLSSGQSLLSDRVLALPAGRHLIQWTPGAALPPRTYLLRLSAHPRLLLGRPATAAAVVRVLGVDAAFAVRSVLPGQTATLVIASDAQSLSLQMLRSGGESEPTYSNDEIKGVPTSGVSSLDWRANTTQRVPVEVEIGADWTPGVYAARLDAADGRVGFAPVIVRSPAPQHRVAVVMPTSTWQAYNFYDADGDGWGDTWYARWKTKRVDLTRPHGDRGVPSHYRRYDLAFQQWLTRSGKSVDTYADEDIESFTDANALRAAYDLIVFPGHTEYVTSRLFDLIEGYRNLGGNLLFLSANNFFRQVERRAEAITLIDEWRNLGRPEASLLGVQYIASDRGERHAPFTVLASDASEWAFAGTGLVLGSQFGSYGIEIDARSAASPPGVEVIATIPNLFGAGRSAEMAYYEHASGARVFSAGVLNFAGQVLVWPQTTQLLENIWERLSPAV